MKDLNLARVIALMDKYDIKDLAEFIESYAPAHVERNEEMKLHCQLPGQKSKASACARARFKARRGRSKR